MTEALTHSVYMVFEKHSTMSANWNSAKAGKANNFYSLYHQYPSPILSSHITQDQLKVVKGQTFLAASEL